MTFVALPYVRSRVLDKIEPKRSHVELLPTISGQSMLVEKRETN